MDGDQTLFTSASTRAAAKLPPDESASQLHWSPVQWVAAGALGLLFVLPWLRPALAADLLVITTAAAFLTIAGWRVILVVVSAGGRPPPETEPSTWPRYTVVAALHDEAEVVGQLIRRLAALDYPARRLQGFLALEADDEATIAAAWAAPRPAWLDILIVPPGRPRTKPRALNHALSRTSGDLLTVYDAEDEPDPGQLREAARRFAADPSGRLACLQAPLRIRRRGRGRSPFLDRQFAAEYASLFEAVLPGLARLELPFPLGGTSNHFRVDALKAVGGWDAWNVTEDADLGFRLWSHGWRLGVLRRPTWETPPGAAADWLPQRTSCVPLSTRSFADLFAGHSTRYAALAG